jgi:regulator of protease activity HflC (stomatin/prohibitin superfamily)
MNRRSRRFWRGQGRGPPEQADDGNHKQSRGSSIMSQISQLPGQGRSLFAFGTKAILGAIGAGLVALWLAFTYYTVAEYERVVVTRWGQFVEVSGPGLHFRMPMMNELRTIRVDIASIEGAKVNTYTIDNQELDAEFVVNFRVPVNQVEHIFKNVPDYKERLRSLTIDRFKAVMGTANTGDIAAKRGEVGRRMYNVLKADAERLFGLEIVDFQITNIEYTKSFKDAVAQAATAKALVEKAEQDKRTVEINADSAKIAAVGQANAEREKARGSADGRLLLAEAEARAIKLKGEAEAAAIRAQTEALQNNPGLVELRKAERWNGMLPQQMLGAVTPFMSIAAPTSPPIGGRAERQ